MGEEKRVEKKEERVNSFPVPSRVVCTLPRFLNGQLIRRGGMDREGELKSFNCDNFKDEVDFNCDNGVEKERDEISLEVKGKVQQVAFLLKTLFFFFPASFNERRMEQKYFPRYFSLSLHKNFLLLLLFFFFTNISYASFLADVSEENRVEEED